MTDSELPKLIEQGRSLVQDVALLIANESEERALDVLNIVCRGLLEEGLTEEMIQRVVRAVWAQRLDYAGPVSSVSRH
jgi:hypothetical protein